MSIMEIIWQTVINTPWWVYVLLVYLLIIGFKASKPRVISVRKLFIIPIIFLGISLHTLFTSVKVNFFSIGIWSSAIFIGILLGIWQIWRFSLRVDREHSLIQVPGTWSTLIIIIIIFAAKYYFGYELAVDPKKIVDTRFEFAMLSVSGLFTGMFVGRLVGYLYRFKAYPSVNLLETVKQK